MSETQRRKKFIKNRIEKDSLKILKQAGIDVDNSIERVVSDQLTKEAELKIQVAYPSVDNTMTSELVYLSQKPEDMYGIEYSKRLKQLKFFDEQIHNLYQFEKGILTAKFDEVRKQPWAQRYFILPNSTPETMPKPEELTLSELILITDDANSAFWRDHHVLPEQAWLALCIAACCVEYTEARYAKMFNERTEKLGWSKAQNGAYVKNECLLTERLKWGSHKNLAWIEETTDLKKYQR